MVADGSRRTPIPLTLRLSLLAGLVVVLASSLLGLMVGVIAADEVLEREGTRQLALAAEMDRLLTQDLLERQRDVVLIAGLLTLEDVSDGVGPERSRAIEDLLVRSLDGPTPLAWFGVLDAQGVVRHTTGLHAVGEVLAGQRWFVEGLAAPAILEEHHDDEPHAPAGDPNLATVDVTAPIRDRDGRSVGVVAAHLPTAWLATRQAEVLAVDAEPGTHLLVLDHHGDIVLPPSADEAPLPGITGTADGERPALGTLSEALAVDGAPAGSVGLTTGSPAGDLLVARHADRRSALLEWEVVVLRSAETVVAGTVAVRNRLIVFGLLTGLATAVVAGLVVRRASRGLRAIDAAARAIRSGAEGAVLPLVDGRDDIAAASRSLRDLTDHLVAQRAQLEATESQLRATLTVQDDFVAMASHEMRTPLTVIRGALEAIRVRGTALDPERRHELLAAADRQLARLERLSRNLLLTQTLPDTGTPEHGASSIGTATVPIDRFTPGALLRELSPAEATLDGDEELVVRGNATLFELVAGNLLDNAVRYGQPPIDLTYAQVTDPIQDHIEVTVRDLGPGVPEEFEPHLFDRFAQASRGMGRQTGGTGLGLWLSRELLRAVGGTITYRRRPGGGASFIFTLPVWPATGPVRASSDPG